MDWRRGQRFLTHAATRAARMSEPATGGYTHPMTTSPNEPVQDPQVVPSGDPAVQPGEDPGDPGPGPDGMPDWDPDQAPPDGS